jgi:NCAIR mutase (PurE)-related protein
LSQKRLAEESGTEGRSNIQAEQLKELFEQVKAGDISVEAAVGKLRHMPFEDLGFAHIDHHRQLRRGFPEVIYCPGKATEHIIEIFSAMAEKGNNVLATRAEEHIFEALTKTKKFPKVRYEKLARAIVLEQRPIKPSKTVVPIVTAGTADLPVAMEAKVTAEIMGQRTELICDVGVAGLHRLLGHLGKFQNANVIIVVAGMEGAVIAVPTSVGYGASFEGLSALLTMLNSCASGVTVVNIDNGFSAGVTATLINKKIEDS